MSKTAKSADHNAPRSGRLTHNADEEVPELLQSGASHGDHPALATERHVHVDTRRLEQLAARVRARGEQPALVGAQAVSAQQHSRAVHRIQQRRRTRASRRCQHERCTVRHGAAATVAAASRPHLLRRRRRPEPRQRPAGRCRRQRTTTARVHGKTQVLKELRPAAEWNEVRDCLVRYDLQRETSEINIIDSLAQGLRRAYEVVT